MATPRPLPLPANLSEFHAWRRDLILTHNSFYDPTMRKAYDALLAADDCTLAAAADFYYHEYLRYLKGQPHYATT